MMNDIVEILQETTNWEFPNHEYHLNSQGKLVAYRLEGKEELHVFKKPLEFSKARRKFKKLPFNKK